MGVTARESFSKRSLVSTTEFTSQVGEILACIKRSTAGRSSSDSRTPPLTVGLTPMLQQAGPLRRVTPTSRSASCAETAVTGIDNFANNRKALHSKNKDSCVDSFNPGKRLRIVEYTRQDELNHSNVHIFATGGACKGTTTATPVLNDGDDVPQSSGNIQLFVWLKFIISFDAGCFSAALGIQGGIADTWKLSVAQQGMLTSSAFLGTVIGCVMAGYCFSTFSEKNVLQITVLVHMIGTLLFASVNSYTLALMSRFLIGTTMAFIVVYTPVWVSFFAPPESQSMWMAAHNVGVPVGIVSGYVAAQGMMKYCDSGWRWAFYFKCVTLVGTMICIAYTRAWTINVRRRRDVNNDGNSTATTSSPLAQSSCATTLSSTQQSHFPTMVVAITAKGCESETGLAPTGFCSSGTHADACDALQRGKCGARDDSARCENDLDTHLFSVDVQNGWPWLYDSRFIAPMTSVRSSTHENREGCDARSASDVEEEKSSCSHAQGGAETVNSAKRPVSSLEVTGHGSNGVGSRENDDAWRRHWLHAQLWACIFARKAREVQKKHVPMLTNSMYMFSVLMLCSLYFISSGLQNFVTLYLRGEPFNTPTSTIVVGFSLCVVIAPVCGAVFGGLVLDHFGSYNNNLFHVSIFCLVAGTVGVLFSIICALMSTTVGFLMTMFVVLVSGGALVPPGAVLTMISLPEDQRVRGAAFASILYNFLGNSGGPLVCGYVAYWTGSLTVAIVLLLLSSSLGLVPMVYILRAAYSRERSCLRSSDEQAQESTPTNVVILNSAYCQESHCGAGEPRFAQQTPIR